MADAATAPGLVSTEAVACSCERIRVRMAPSPTGYFHVGSARTALFNWLFARQQGGTFVLRIEDTDALRNRAEHAEGIERAMLWLGLDWDEGPYFQSERGELYEAAIDQLLAKDLVYACDCNRGQVAERNKAGWPATGSTTAIAATGAWSRHPGACCASARLTRAPRPGHDIVRGEVVYENSSIEDFSVRKSNGQPLFILANVVDDGDMAISHVIRGEDHVPNTPKYVLLWEALELGHAPSFAHLPLLVNESRQKLSKRRDKVALEDYRDEGYLPEAMFNYLALLGWSPGNDREILSKQELIDEFRLENVKSSPAFFDQQKLSSVNATYLRALSPDEFVARAGEWLNDRWAPIAPLVQERARTLAEVYSMVDFLYLPEVKIDQAEWDKARRQQPAFVALLGTAEGNVRTSATGRRPAIREATLEAGAAVGVSALGKAQAPVRLGRHGAQRGAASVRVARLVGPPAHPGPR